MMGYCANVYRFKDEKTISKVIRVCVVAHTIASKHDRLQDVSDWLAQGNLTEDMQYYMNARTNKRRNRIARIRQQEAQRSYEQQQQEQMATLSKSRQDTLCSVAAHDLREEMHVALFNDMEWNFVDTNEDSRCRER